MEPNDTISEDELPLDIEDMSDEELVALAEEMAAEDAQASKDREETLDDLARSIEAKFFDRARRRSTKEQEWRESMELYLGNLSNIAQTPSYEQPFANYSSSNRPYYNIVRNKCDIAVAQSVSMQFAGGEKNWSLGPAMNEEDPAEVQKAHGMETEIEVQLEHCSYGKKCRRAIEDRVILGVGILKGPVNTGVLYNTYAPSEIDPNMWMPVTSDAKYPAVERVNPWFFYPDDTVNDFSQSPDCIQVHPKKVFDLKRLAQHPGFDADMIKEALKVKPDEYMLAINSEYGQITSSNPFLFQDSHLVLEYHGPITADELSKLSIEPSYDSIDDEYYGEVWVCNGKVIRIELENIEAAFELPYSVSVWMKDPSSWAGFGAPQLMKDAQRVAKETWRMILDNASASSGPQVIMHKHFVEPADNKWEIEPRKVWYATDSSVDVQKAFQFFTVPNVVGSLMPVLDASRTFAEEESSTPMISAGMSGGEMTESATGALLLQQNSTTILDFLSEEWDDNVTEKIIRRYWAWNMQYGTKPEIKGNYRIDVRTSTEYKNKQQFIRDMERLRMNVTQDPELSLIVDKEALTRASLAMMHIPSGDIVRSPEEVAKLRAEMAQNQKPDPKMLELELKKEELRLRGEELKLKAAGHVFELNQQQKREEWEHEEKMSANYARTIESQAMVLRSQNDKETEMLQLAARMEEGSRKNSILQQIAVMNNETKRFTAMMDNNAKARESLLIQTELKLKATTGSGI